MTRRKSRLDGETLLPVTVSRVLDASEEIIGTPDTEEMAFLHIVLAQCGLPYRDPKTSHYIRENGLLSLIVSPGHLRDPTTNKAGLQGIPYGAKPRLLMLHLCTEAVRSREECAPKWQQALQERRISIRSTWAALVTSRQSSRPVTSAFACADQRLWI